MTKMFGFLWGSLMFFCTIPQNCLILSQGRKAAALTKTKFLDMSIFFAILVRSYDGVRLLQGSRISKKTFVSEQTLTSF